MGSGGGGVLRSEAVRGACFSNGGRCLPPSGGKALSFAGSICFAMRYGEFRAVRGATGAPPLDPAAAVGGNSTVPFPAPPKIPLYSVPSSSPHAIR